MEAFPEGGNLYRQCKLNTIPLTNAGPTFLSLSYENIYVYLIYIIEGVILPNKKASFIQKINIKYLFV